MEPPKGWRLAAREWGDRRERRGQAKRGRVLGVLIWNDDVGEGEVLLVPGFELADGLLAKDALSDWGGLLDREYDAWCIRDGRIGPAQKPE